MDPRKLKRQTSKIIECVFDDDNDDRTSDFRGAGSLASDATVEDDTFDPVLIADKLKEMVDKLNKDKEFQAAVSELRAAAEQDMISAFSKGVETLCNIEVSQQPAMAPEMQLIQASIALGLYVKNKAPELKNRVQRAMITFLNTRVVDWVNQQGGWDIVADS
ncbi:uncharacterized protein ACJ7VT_011825 [Polymixia lowei]